MANILHQANQIPYVVPGLAYDKPAQVLNTLLLDAVPTSEELVYLMEHHEPGTVVSPWTVDVLQGFKDYIPTTFNTITRNFPPELYAEFFGEREPESREKILLQLQTEISGKASTIDAAIINSRRDYGTVVSKVHQMNRLYRIGQLIGALGPRDYPMLLGLEERTDDQQKWDSVLSDVKQLSIEYLLEIDNGNRKYPEKDREAHVSQHEIRTLYPYLEWLQKKLGDDLIGVLLYGSAARTNDPAKFSDYDNWVRVKDVRRAQNILRGTNPFLIDGKVIEGHRGKDPEGAKHIGIHLFPESKDYLLKYIQFLHDSREFLHHTKVLYGEFPFVKVAQDEIVTRGLSAAYVKLKTVAGGLNRNYPEPEVLIGKEALFEFFTKISRFFLQHALNAKGDEPIFRDKHRVNELLAERGMHVPEYRPDPEYIRASMVDTMVSVLKLQEELLENQVATDLSFLTDTNVYGSWTGTDLNVWPK